MSPNSNYSQGTGIGLFQMSLGAILTSSTFDNLCTEVQGKSRTLATGDRRVFFRLFAGLPMHLGNIDFRRLERAEDPLEEAEPNERGHTAQNGDRGTERTTPELEWGGEDDPHQANQDHHVQNSVQNLHNEPHNTQRQTTNW